MPSVIIFGATGFVGAPLTRAIKDAHPDWPLTAYVRPGRSIDELKATLPADKFEFGDFNDFDKIKALSKEHDIAINAGASFTAEPVVAIIVGLKERPTASKGKLIHITGAGNYIDFGTSGNFNPESKVWNDDKEEDIRMISKDMFNGASDVPVLEAGREGLIDTYIVCPSVTYGGASINSPTIGIGYNLIIGNAKSVGYVPYVGEGTAVVSTAHILDVVPFIVKIAETAAAGPAEGTAESRFYMLETARVQWKDLAAELAKVMHGKGIFESEEAKAVAIEDAGKTEVKYLVAANMLIQGDRAKRMGFKAEHPSILEEVHADLKGAAL